MYYGNWRPSEQIKSTDPESQKVNQKISEYMEVLKNKRVNFPTLRSSVHPWESKPYLSIIQFRFFVG
ncbi:DUF6809 family protein [Paenibacillus polymyxa]|uniref:DUF6809 family protein n=1 Tax=Paenibacillus polymyxa TaxID=1406 RepID=UPI002F264E23